MLMWKNSQQESSYLQADPEPVSDIIPHHDKKNTGLLIYKKKQRYEQSCKLKHNLKVVGNEK
jgi:hypothetical protein